MVATTTAADAVPDGSLPAAITRRAVQHVQR
jgi:hypothetical protein